MSNRFGFFGIRHSGGESSNAVNANFAVSYSIANANSVIFSITSNVTAEPEMRYVITGVNSTAFTDNTLTDTFNLDANGNATIIKTIDPTSISDSGNFSLQIQRGDGLENFVTSSNVTILTVSTFKITGGTTGTRGSNSTITISSNTTINVTKQTDPWLGTDNTIMYIEMVGGGGGGWGHGGMGGQPAFFTKLANTISAGNYTAVVGTGGPAKSGVTTGRGKSTSIFGQTVNGGNGALNINPIAEVNLAKLYGGNGGIGQNLTSQNDGGFGIWNGAFRVTGGVGGAGVTSAVSGRTYGGGGGGGAWIDLAPTSGDYPWQSIGGAGVNGGGNAGQAGEAGTGGGGGGGYSAPSQTPVTIAGAGGNGVIYIEIPLQKTYNVLKP